MMLLVFSIAACRAGVDEYHWVSVVVGRVSDVCRHFSTNYTNKYVDKAVKKDPMISILQIIRQMTRFFLLMKANDSMSIASVITSLPKHFFLILLHLLNVE